MRVRARDGPRRVRKRRPGAGSFPGGFAGRECRAMKKTRSVPLGLLFLLSLSSIRLINAAVEDNGEAPETTTGLPQATPTTNNSQNQQLEISTVDVSGTAEALTKFALQMYCAQSEFDSQSNIIFSPLSITTGLSLVYLGARGETADEMKAAMGLQGNPEDEQLHRAIASMSANTESLPSFKSASNVFLGSDKAIESTYLTTVENIYNTKPELLDFSVDPEQSRREINQWVEDRTEKRIKDLLPEESLDADTTLVLVTALYFAGQWQHKFDPTLTEPGIFLTKTGAQVTVDFMRREHEFNYGELPEINSQVIELPYADRYSMIIVLPTINDGLYGVDETLCGSALTVDLTASILSSISERVNKKTMVEVMLPKFTIEGEMSLMSVLQKLQITSLFSEEADLSGIDATGRLFVSGAHHKAFIEIDEEGTTAAAATGISVVLRSPPVPFIVDHPFFFLIKDRTNDAILFIGRIMNPL